MLPPSRDVPLSVLGAVALCTAGLVQFVTLMIHPSASVTGQEMFIHLSSYQLLAVYLINVLERA